MTQRDDTTSAAGDRRRFEAAVGTAAVAGIFCLIIVGLLVARKLQDQRLHPLTSREALELAAARQELLSRPGDEELREEIRRRDEALTTAYLRDRALYGRATWLLVGGSLVLVIGANLAWRYRKRLLSPDAKRVVGYDARVSRWARGGLAGLLVLLGAGGAFLAVNAQGLNFESIASGPAPGAGPKAAAPGPAVVSTQPAAAPTATAPQPAQADAAPDAQGWPRVASFPTAAELARNWPRFRGPGGLGLAPTATPPLNFDLASGKNLAWKAIVPLPGQSSPVVWGRRVFLTGADHDDKKRQVYCYDADTGKLLWARDVIEGAKRLKKPEHVMEDTGFAAPTMVADAERVYAIFAMGEIVCFDHAGNKVWGRYLGPLQTDYGHAASLVMQVIHATKARLFVQLDQATEEDGKSKLVALDAATGRIDGQVQRPVGSSWTSPILIRTPAGEQIITCANPLVIAYDAADGKELWRAECLAGDGAPSPTFADGKVIAGNISSRMCAIRPDGSGNVTKTHILWSSEYDVPDVCSPVSDGKSVYMLTSDGLLTCLGLADGKKVYQQDLKASFSASPTVAGGRLYVLSTDGALTVAQAGPQYKELATSKLGEKCTATPAFVGGDMFIRAKGHLYCIREAK